MSLNSFGLNSKTPNPKCRTADVNDSRGNPPIIYSRLIPQRPVFIPFQENVLHYIIILNIKIDLIRSLLIISVHFFRQLPVYCLKLCHNRLLSYLSYLVLTNNHNFQLFKFPPAERILS